jgi:ribosome-binding protein aMBF1 (putative translation factor)
MGAPQPTDSSVGRKRGTDEKGCGRKKVRAKKGEGEKGCGQKKVRTKESRKWVGVQYPKILLPQCHGGEKGFSQTELAKRIDTSHSIIGKY